MRYLLTLCLIEAILVGSVAAISHNRARDPSGTAASLPETPITRRAAETIRAPETRDIAAVFRAAQAGLERRLSADERAADLGPGLDDAILRLEGMFDPTRVGLFGPALRLQVRPGTASMSNVFGDGWTRVSLDPNIHRQTTYLAEAWLAPRAVRCEEFWKFRADESAVMLDRLTPGECALVSETLRDDGRLAVAPVVAVPLSLPAFAAPYPGGRMSQEELAAVQAAHVQALKEQHWFRHIGPGTPFTVPTIAGANAGLR